MPFVEKIAKVDVMRMLSQLSQIIQLPGISRYA